MGKAKDGVEIENENLYRALVCSPIAIFLILTAPNFLTSSGLILFKIIFVFMTLYFSLCALAYSAFYANQVSAKSVDSIIKNRNLSSVFACTPLAVVFWFFTVNSVVTNGHMVFTVMYALIAIYFTLSALAYAAFTTNDYYAETI